MAVTTGRDVPTSLPAAQHEVIPEAEWQGWRSGQGLHSSSAEAVAWVPAVDLAERADAFLVTVELPGVKADEVEIALEDGLLTIQGERRPAHGAAADKLHMSERGHGIFRRSVTLPSSHVRADGIETSMLDGVLEIVVPKAPPVRASRLKLVSSG